MCTFAKKLKYMPKTPVTREPMAMRLDKAAIAYLRFHRIRPNSVLNSLLCDYVRHCQRDDQFYCDVKRYGHHARYKLVLDGVS